jgi:carbon-monoxide dehydrogenase small subunit
MVLSAIQILEDNLSPSEEEIRAGLDGNLCRCTGYQHIVNSVQRAVRTAAAVADGRGASR